MIDLLAYQLNKVNRNVTEASNVGLKPTIQMPDCVKFCHRPMNEINKPYNLGPPNTRKDSHFHEKTQSFREKTGLTS